MAYVWMFIAGVVALVLVAVIFYAVGVAHQANRQLNEARQKLGLTRKDAELYREVMKLISDITQHAALNDALAPIGEQTLLSDDNKNRISELLARYRKEHS